MLPHNFHDWYVVRYEHCCAERQLIIDLEPPAGVAGPPMRVTFYGVAGVQLNSPWRENILFEIFEDEPDPSLEADPRAISEMLDPAVLAFKYGESVSLPDVLEALHRAQLKVFGIRTSYGLSGWILAERVTAEPQPEDIESTL